MSSSIIFQFRLNSAQFWLLVDYSSVLITGWLQLSFDYLITLPASKHCSGSFQNIPKLFVNQTSLIWDSGTCHRQTADRQKGPSNTEIRPNRDGSENTCLRWSVSKLAKWDISNLHITAFLNWVITKDMELENTRNDAYLLIRANGIFFVQTD